MDEKTLFKLTYGLFVLTSKCFGKDNGCIVNTVSQVTATPNRISVTVNKANITHNMIVESGEFNVSILSEKSKFSTYQHWGMQSGKDVDKLESVKFNRSSNGLVYITEEANAFISAKVVQKIDLGTHTLFIADVTDGEILNNDESVTYSFYHKNIKTAFSAPKKDEKTNKNGFICVICGYIYEGENLPSDFICPICKHPASDFEPL
ncbi:MAG: flavin reductase [Sphaerochaetaceae bacterium]|nr:flavin reductase [Sphaerochaetaceae bacterium]